MKETHVSLDNFEFQFFHRSNIFFPNYFSGGNKKSSSIAQLAIPATSPRELLGSEQQQKQMDHHHPASGFGTKDSSDSKSHDSGIDSIEKPGMSFGVLRFVG